MLNWCTLIVKYYISPYRTYLTKTSLGSWWVSLSELDDEILDILKEEYGWVCAACVRAGKCAAVFGAGRGCSGRAGTAIGMWCFWELGGGCFASCVVTPDLPLFSGVLDILCRVQSELLNRRASDFEPSYLLHRRYLIIICYFLQSGLLFASFYF